MNALPLPYSSHSAAVSCCGAVLLLCVRFLTGPYWRNHHHPWLLRAPYSHVVSGCCSPILTCMRSLGRFRSLFSALKYKKKKALHCCRVTFWFLYSFVYLGLKESHISSEKKTRNKSLRAGRGTFCKWYHEMKKRQLGDRGFRRNSDKEHTVASLLLKFNGQITGNFILLAHQAWCT